MDISVNDIKQKISEMSTTDRKANRETILRYEDTAKELPQVKIPVDHITSNSMYARKIVIPKGLIITGDIYKFDHLDIMISGHMIVSTDNGEIKELKGFNMFQSFSGKKRAGIRSKKRRG